MDSNSDAHHWHWGYCVVDYLPDQFLQDRNRNSDLHFERVGFEEYGGLDFQRKYETPTDLNHVDDVEVVADFDEIGVDFERH